MSWSLNSNLISSLNSWNNFQSQFGGSGLTSVELSHLYKQYGAGLGTLPAPVRRHSSARDTLDIRRELLTARTGVPYKAPSKKSSKASAIMDKYNAMYKSKDRVPEPVIQEEDDEYFI